MNKTLSHALTALLAVGATSASADILHLDDVIIDGSLCVGFDCVNGESFGFDTIRLKENNLRIKADDTSNSASFPSNDWQITFNDTSNGGANKFSIDDITGGRTPFTIEAAARSNSLYVESDGDIGIGTANPVVDVHVVTGNTPTLRLEQDGSSGFAAQTWDVAGNETNFFVRDVTNGSTLPFRIFPSAPSSSLSIEGSTGDIGIGTTSPAADLDISRSGQVIVQLTDRGTGGEKWDIVLDSAGANNGLSFTRVGSGVREFRIANDGAIFTGVTQVHPDYVFEAEYELMPLGDLADYVRQNKHLPGVQTAEQVQKEGVNMSALQIQLLKKVEELTLYTITQEQSIRRLEEKLAVLDLDKAQQ